MTERLLDKDLDQIREWIEQGRTDAWIAHRLEVTGAELLAFKRRHGMAPEAEPELEADDEADRLSEDGSGDGGLEQQTPPSSYEATFDHGEQEGYGVWLDPALKDDPVYLQHWRGKRAVEVTISQDEIVLRRSD